MANAAEKKIAQDAETAKALGLGDHRPLTTGDLPALAEYVKETGKASKPKAKKDKGNTSNADNGKEGS